MKSLNLFILFIALTSTSISFTKKDRDKEDNQEPKTTIQTPQSTKSELVPVNRSHEWLKFLWNSGTSLGLAAMALTMFHEAKNYYLKSLNKNTDYLTDITLLGACVYSGQAMLDAAYSKYIASLQALKKAWDGFAYISKQENN